MNKKFNSLVDTFEIFNFIKFCLIKILMSKVILIYPLQEIFN